MRENKHQRPNVTFLTLHNHCIGISLGENNTYAVVVNFLSTFNLVGLEVLHQGLHEVLGALASPGVVAAQIGEGRGEWPIRGTGGDWRGWANLFNLACRGDLGFLHTYCIHIHIWCRFSNSCSYTYIYDVGYFNTCTYTYIYDVVFLTHVHTHTYRSKGSKAPCLRTFHQMFCFF